MTTRRDFMATAALGATGLVLAPLAARANEARGKPPMRFIFLHKGNGQFPSFMVPPTLSKDEAATEAKNGPLDLDLMKHELPKWMLPITAHQRDTTILQGLSGKHCTTTHNNYCSALGVFKATERISSIKWATVDFELAKLFPSPIEHIELACLALGSGKSVDGIATGFSARAPQQPNYAFASPKVAAKELFKSFSNDKSLQAESQLGRAGLEFAARRERQLAQDLASTERLKVESYADSLDAIRTRDRKMDAMAEAIRPHVPKLEAKYLADEMTTVDRQRGHTEVLMAALISGLTNVAAFTLDELGAFYTGLPGLEGERVSLHDVGHGTGFGKLTADEIRFAIQRQHMAIIDTIATRLKAAKEGDGTVFDNTMIFYFPDGGETHHAIGTEYPFVVLSGKNAKLNIRGRYIRLPNYGDPGHKTLGNWYTTLLNVCGNPVKHYGDLDSGLDRFGIDQTGAIKQFIG